MQSWLPTLERKLEVAAESGHDDFRCYLSAEPPPLHDQQTIPEGILQARAGARAGARARVSQQTMEAP